MDPAVFDNAYILTGPTASGKSAVGEVLAERWDAEIVAMDSMTLYRGMDIGTAKTTREIRECTRHHLIDVLDPWESASLAWWLDRAADCVRDIESRGKRVLFVGGTGLYLKAVLRGIFEAPAGDAALRTSLESLDGRDLHARLARIDPAAAARLHPNDVRRLARAVEVFETTGRAMSEWQREFKRVRSRPRPVLWLHLPRESLCARIDQRVLAMIQAGLADEVRRLMGMDRPLSREARQALGYKEMIDHLEGRFDLKETVERIQLRSRQFAKRQLTWFRNLPECLPLDVAKDEPPERIAERCLRSPGWR